MLILAQNVLFVERVRASMARKNSLEFYSILKLYYQFSGETWQWKEKYQKKKTYHTLWTIFGGQEISAQSRGIHKKWTVRYHAQTD